MWPFSKQPTVVTTEQLAWVVAKFMQKCVGKVTADVQTIAEGKWRLDLEERNILAHEIGIAFLWATSNVLRYMASDKALLDLLHDRYFLGYQRNLGGAAANAAQDDLFERYALYYAAHDKAPQPTAYGYRLGSDMANCFFPKRRPVMDFHLCNMIYIPIQLFMSKLLELRAAYKLQS